MSNDVQIIRGFPIYLAQWPMMTAMTYTANRISERYFAPLVAGFFAKAPPWF